MTAIVAQLGILILWRNRYRLGLVFLATALSAAVIHWQWEASRELVGISLVCTFYFLFGVLCNTRADALRGFSGLSPEFFLLPVRTGAVVLAHLVVGFGVIAVALGLWFGLVLRSVTWSFSLLELVVFLCACFSVFASLVWGLARTPRIRMVALVVGFFLMLGLSLGPLGLNAASVSFWSVHRGSLLTGLVALTFVCPFFFLPMIASDRSGGRVRWEWPPAWWYRILPWRWVSDRFLSSPTRALFVKELAQAGWLLPAVMLLLTGIANVIAVWRYFWWGKVQDEVTATLSNALIFTALVLGAMLQGLLLSQFGRSAWSEDRRMATFHGVLPVTTESMVVVKLMASIVSLVISWFIVLFGVSFWYWVWEVAPPWVALRAAHYQGFESGDAWPFAGILLLALILSWRSMTGLTWLGMLGRRGALELGLVLVAFQVGLLVSVATWEGSFRSSWVGVLTAFFFYAWMVAKLLVCAISLRALGPARDRIRSFALGYTLCWIAFTLAAVGSADWLSRFLGCPRSVVVPAMMVIMPLGSVFAALAAGSANRHQK